MLEDNKQLHNDVYLGLFAKYWQPGRVKTRLASSIGEIQAADVYRTFLETLLWRFGPAAENGARNTVVYSPSDRERDFRTFAMTTCEDSGWTFMPQGEGDLGQRLHRFFAQAVESKEHPHVLVMGTDSPTIPSSYLFQAHRLLNSNDVVLGPTEDGGYYLVGAKANVPPIFDDIEWSTDQVWSQTVQRLEANGVKYGVLPKWYDVDTVDDLKRLRAGLAEELLQPAERTYEALEQRRGAGYLSGRLEEILAQHEID